MRTSTNEVVVLIQLSDESFEDFRGRIEQRLERLRAPNISLEEILVVAGNQNEAGDGERAQLLTSILAQLPVGTVAARVSLDSGLDHETVARA